MTLNRDLFLYDCRERERSGDMLCGVDEAGRGPLAGPVAAAAVILPPSFFSEDLDDSKRMTARRREKVFDLIQKEAVCCAVVLIDNVEIDRINILEATMTGMRRAVEMLPLRPDSVLVDGNRLPEGIGCARAVVGGDALSASVAAASVLAKVTRDRHMIEMEKRYPGYHFDRHKGYPTRLHYEMIDKLGITPIHRRTFLKGRTG